MTFPRRTVATGAIIATTVLGAAGVVEACASKDSRRDATKWQHYQVEIWLAI
jgi:hypothetical protein